MNSYFAYVRVSTPRQGQAGVSLAEQRQAITRFAESHNLTITTWFEEIETAAKSGRKVFKEMVTRLSRKEASGLIMHKIDRGARNLHDWAAIGDLIDCGVAIRFAHDDLRMDSRGGRLAADIQAVVAADYVRNLREEIRKGIEGRLRQGVYPFAAPLGYLDQGGGRAKILDPERASFVAETFRLYATGQYAQRDLADIMGKRGFRNRRGKPLCFNAINVLLGNSFYTGTMSVRGVLYPGIHEPIISQELFEKVQSVPRRRKRGEQARHSFLYRRFLRCDCNAALCGERQRGQTYYRCHSCKGVCFREDVITEHILKSLQRLRIGSRIELETLLTPIAKRHGKSADDLIALVSDPAMLFRQSSTPMRRQVLELLATHCSVGGIFPHVAYRPQFLGFLQKSSNPVGSLQILTK